MDECWYWNCSIPKCMIHDASCKKMLGTVFHDNKFEALLPHSISPHCLPCPRYCTRQYGGVCTPQGSPIPSDENERSLWVIFWAFCCFFLCKQVARTYVRLGRILSFSVVALLHAACSWIFHYHFCNMVQCFDVYHVVERTTRCWKHINLCFTFLAPVIAVMVRCYIPGTEARYCTSLFDRICVLHL